ncbi:MAG: hypothetical protein M3Q73_01710 [bacterium]|nr:hypothetical protein [bacterium]
MKKITATIFALTIIITAVGVPQTTQAVETGFFNIIPCDGVDQEYLKNEAASHEEARKKALQEFNSPSNREVFYVLYKRGTSLDQYTFSGDVMTINPSSTYSADGQTVTSGGATYTGPDIMAANNAFVALKSGQYIDVSVQGNRVGHQKKMTLEELTQKYLIKSEPSKTTNDTCNFGHLIQMIQNIIRAIIILSIPATMIVLTWVGVVLLTAVGNVSKIQYAKGVAWKVIIGFITILLAWLLVEAIYIAITGQGFNDFLK